MQRVDGFYLYTVGNQIHPVADFRYAIAGGQAGTRMVDAFFTILVAEGALEPLLNRSVFKLRTSQGTGQTLLNALRTAKENINNAQDKNTPLDATDVYAITSSAAAFEAVLNAELAVSPFYIVTQKGGFDTGLLIEKGAACFPDEISVKAPEAIPDLEQGTKCIAFDLPTAAGFHLHRANESVLRRYWDAVTGGAKRPKSRNIGDYLNGMDKKKVGDKKVKAALRDLKDLHRNPLIHPDHTLESADQAIALMNNIHTVVVYMLAAIPGSTKAPSVGSGPALPAAPSSS